MSFGRTKRLLMGLLALLAPLPLPFNEVVSWPPLIAYGVAVALFLRRARREPERWLPRWAMNVLGLAYLPVFFFDLTVLEAGRVVGPVVHLLLFVVVVKLYALARERDKWQTLMAVFFLFLASMATSTHPSVVLFLVAFLVLTLLLLTRFAFLHILSGFGHDDVAPALLPLRSFLTFSTLLILLVAIPLFAVLPRVKAPYIIGRGTGTGTVIAAAGFSDEITLDTIGLARDNPEVVMRVRYQGPRPAEHELRFKAGAHEEFRNGVWLRTREGGRAVHREPGATVFRVADGQPVALAQVWLRPLLGRRLALPVETVAVAVDVGLLERSDLGTVSLVERPSGVLQYRVHLARLPVSGAPAPLSVSAPSLDLSGVTPEITELAAVVMGEGSPRRRAEALVRHFHQEYDYTLDFLGRASDTPLEDFLFKYKSGHCEYFASAMVLMLRSQGIPARLVTGFLGGEYNPLEGYYIVRQLNAHAWVEAYLPGEGWQVFDPTPPGGRPTSSSGGWTGLLGQAYDYLVFRWDRYVVTYGFYDQVRMFLRLRELWQGLWSAFDRPDEAPGTPGEAPAEEGGPGAEPSPADGPGSLPVTALLLALLAATVAGLLYRRSASLDATAAYRRLSRRLRRRGVPAGAGTAPLALRQAAGARFPQAAAATGRVVELYLEASFGDRRLAVAEQQELRQALAAALKGLRQRP